MKKWIARIAVAVLTLSLVGEVAVAADGAFVGSHRLLFLDQTLYPTTIEGGDRVDTHLLFLNERLYPDTYEADPAQYEWLILAYG